MSFSGYRFWARVRATEDELTASGVGEAVWLVSIDSPRPDLISYGGRVTQVDRRNAAKLLVRGRHRLASEQEIGEHQSQQGREAQRIRDEQGKRDGLLTVRVPDSIGG